MTESELQREIMKAVAPLGARLFRNNVAKGWIGASVGPTSHDQFLFVRAGSVIIADARRLHSGLVVGSSDLIGWSSTGLFTALEIKSARGKLTEEQEDFLAQVQEADGIGLCARSVEDVLEVLRNRSR